MSLVYGIKRKNEGNKIKKKTVGALGEKINQRQRSADQSTALYSECIGIEQDQKEQWVGGVSLSFWHTRNLFPNTHWYIAALLRQSFLRYTFNLDPTGWLKFEPTFGT